MVKRSLVLASVLTIYMAAPAAAQVPNHSNVVAEVRRQATADELKTEAGILQVLVRVVCALPPAERAGLHAKPAGENIAFYAPANTRVGISRLMYPDGSLVKVFGDAGPGGANSAGWTPEAPIDKTRYVPVTCGATPAPTPVDPPAPADVEFLLRIATLEGRLETLEQQIPALWDSVGGLITALTARVDELSAIATNADAKVENVLRILESRPIPDGCRATFGCRLTFNHPPIR